MPGNCGKDYMVWGRKQGHHAREVKRMRNTQRALRSNDKGGMRELISPKQPGMGYFTDSRDSRAGRERRQLNQRHPKRTPGRPLGQNIAKAGQRLRFPQFANRRTRRVAAGQGQGPRVRAGMSLEGRVRAQMLGPQVRAGPKLEARP